MLGLHKGLGSLVITVLVTLSTHTEAFPVPLHRSFPEEAAGSPKCTLVTQSCSPGAGEGERKPTAQIESSCGWCGLEVEDGSQSPARDDTVFL